MDELIKALTRAANAAADYYEKAGQPQLPLTAPVAEPVKEEKAPKAPKAEKAPKAAKAEKTPETPAAPAAPVAVGSEADKKSTEDVRAKAKFYVQRFANQMEGIAAYRALMKATCGVEKMDDLKHEQRLAVIAAVEKAVNDLNNAKPAAPAGVEV
jgi:uncharacterized phage protein gp47/JayE